MIEDIYRACRRPNPSKSVSNATLSLTTSFIPSTIVSPQEIEAVSFAKCTTDKELTEEYRFDVRRWKLDPEYAKPQRLFYGFGVDIQDFIEYHQRHQLPPPPSMDRRANLWHAIMDAVMDDLSAHCKFELRRIPPLSRNYNSMIVLYNSHHISVQELEDDEEADVIRIITERFGNTVARQNARWFHPLMEE
ncbi:hypothetical protein BDP27DRAFT_1435445 [Rhodocollybia butyracea]|uniref:Uncharacterized protein n=1 Tax=Rhodocollybia butyracea TaxID=206335 RepID=A0A9P5P7Q3_9AGAR|nr:hypothetical protein BDP27DRAFT_1435445 [Rhodocollybia butyracea]